MDASRSVSPDAARTAPRVAARIAVAIALAFSTTVSAVPAALAHGNCRSFDAYNDWVGTETSSPNYSRTAIQAFVEFTGYSDLCINDPPFDLGNGPSAWVALVPRTGATFSTIIQVGIIRCHDDTIDGDENTACDQSSAYRYFVAYAGCNGVEPRALDRGAAPTSRVSYVIWREWSPYVWVWRFNANGVNVLNIAESDPAVSCWLGQNRKALWSSERWDRGDFQGWSAHPIAWDTAAFKAPNSANWQYPNWTSCNYGLPFKADQWCLASGNAFQDWTTYDTGQN